MTCLLNSFILLTFLSILSIRVKQLSLSGNATEFSGQEVCYELLYQALKILSQHI